LKAKVGFTIDQEVLKEIDALRDLATRSAFANEILKQGLRAYKATHKKSKAPYPAITIDTAEETALAMPREKP
jgi:metal-responsive CopG/Arc/MetJ family transcriptional regulator